MDEYISREALSDHVMAYGRQISRCVVTDQSRVRFEIGNWVCDGKVYFVVKADGKIGECMEISAKAPAADVVSKWKGADFDKTCGDCIHADICEHNPSIAFGRENIAWCDSFKDKADVVEVRHGEWITDAEDLAWGNALKRKHCSECGGRPHWDNDKREFILTKFCHHCGAKMDGGVSK